MALAVMTAHDNATPKGLGSSRGSLGVSRKLLFVGIQESDQVCSVLFLLESSKDHLGARNVLLWVGQVYVQSLFVPCDPLRLVSLGVGEVRSLPSFPPNKAKQVWTLLMFSSLVVSVALGTSLHENLLSVVNAHPRLDKVS